MCRSFAELAQMVSQEILVSLCDFRRRQRGRGAPIHLPLPIGGPKGCHLAELDSKVTTDAPSSYHACLVIIRPQSHCESVKKGQEERGQRTSPLRQKGNLSG